MDAALAARLTAAIEALAAASRPQQSRATTLLKEISYIKEFDGNRSHLTQFLNVVSNHLDAIEEDAQKQELWQLIFNCKVTGKAKELLLNNPHENWQQAKELLKQHFRPSANYKDIARKISGLRVSSIFDLNCKIENIIQDINTFATYETNCRETKESFYILLVNQIKQIVTGNLSREIKDLFDIHKIKEILYSYVGYDHHNLDKDFLTNDRRQNPHPKHRINVQQNTFTNNNPQNNYPNNRNRPNSNQFRQNTHSPQQQNFRSNSGQFRQPIFNPSGQIRNAFQRPEPMEIGQVVHGESEEPEITEEVHNIEPAFFLI